MDDSNSQKAGDSTFISAYPLQASTRSAKRWVRIVSANTSEVDKSPVWLIKSRLIRRQKREGDAGDAPAEPQEPCGSLAPARVKIMHRTVSLASSLYFESPNFLDLQDPM